MKKRLLMLLFVLCAAVCCASGASAAEIVDSGYCGGEGDGTNLTWMLDSEGVLTISGTGAMKNYYYYGQDVPWYSHCNKIKSAIISGNVISIGECVFLRCSNLTDVIIPNSVTEIGCNAFEDCTSLMEVTIPNSVTEIGSWAFSGCTSLMTVKIPNNVTYIGVAAFAGCKSLTTVTLPDSVTEIEDGLFSGCTELKTVTIPETITHIKPNSFNDCVNLTMVTIPGSVTEIGGWAFSGCTSLTKVKIPSSVTYVGEEAFAGCKGLTSIRISNGAAPISFGWNVFIGCTGLTEVTIMNSMIRLGGQMFLYCSNLKNIYYSGTKEQWSADNVFSKYAEIPHDTIIHYESTGPKKPSVSIKENQYCLQVVDANGSPLSDAEVTVGTMSGTTDCDGLIFFPVPKDHSTLITIKKNGYYTWDNLDGTWTPGKNHYGVIVLNNTDTNSAYKLSVANYYASTAQKFLGNTVNLLTKTKTLNLKNEGNLIGDLSLGNFYIQCATAEDDAESFELWQGDNLIAQSADGNFNLNVKDFSRGGGCFVRVIAENGGMRDTKINLQFVENELNAETEFSLKGNSFTFSVADSVPYLGGKSLTFELPVRCPIYYALDGEKVIIGLNIKQFGGSLEEVRKQRSEYEHMIRRSAAFGNIQWNQPRNQKTSDLLKRYIEVTNKPHFFSPNCEFTVSGYFEAPIGSNTATGYLILTLDATIADYQYTTPMPPPVFIPVTVNAGVELSADFGDELAMTIHPLRLTGSNLFLNPTLNLEAFGGFGVGKFCSVGAYGSAELEVGWNILGTKSGLQNVDLTGNLGLKAYFANAEYPKIFAHNTWHLYAPDNADNVALQSADMGNNLYANFYSAENYKLSDLSYLSAESDWQGGASLMDASARTELVSLLSDTYRNAQPVMIATDSALYAAFVRADVDSGERYVVVTKFDGSTWSEPVRADANAVLDSAPVLYADGDTVYLAYARTTENPGDSLLAYALEQEIVVGSVNPDTLSFTEQTAFSGMNSDTSFVSMPQLSAVSGQLILAWADSTVSDDNSVLRPVSSVLRYAACVNGTWESASSLGSVNAPVNSLTLGERNGSPVAACLLDEDSGSNLYLVTGNGQEKLAENVSGRVTYGTLPGTTGTAFLWNTDSGLTSSGGDSVEVPGISGEYVVLDNNIYYSTATRGSANLAVLQYHADTGTWSLPIQLTDGDRYLENLSVASLNGTDYVLGMHTAATITEDSVEDAKNLVWSAVSPVSDLRLDSIDYDAEEAVAGENVPVTLSVINAGDHVVRSVEVKLNSVTVKTEECSLNSDESLEITVPVTASQFLTEYQFAVEEPGEDDYNPDDNSATIQIGYADAALVLDYQQIGTHKSLMATVTNQGIETASGSIVFYDADGNAVAESAFTDLATGDTAIAVFELDENFAGIHGGDVSAQVIIEQEELYTYNNLDTLHIMETETVAEGTRIVSTASDGAGEASAEIFCEERISATVFCAFYDSNRKMVDLETRNLLAGNNSVAFTNGGESASEAKFIVLDRELRPLCASEKVNIA